MHHIIVCELESRVDGVLSTLPEVVSAWEGYPCTRFPLMRPPNLHCPRKLPIQVLSCNYATRFFLDEDSLAMREATVVVMSKYVSQSLTIAVARSAIASTLLSVFQSRAFAEG